jgi:hypothetical protein
MLYVVDAELTSHRLLIRALHWRSGPRVDLFNTILPLNRQPVFDPVDASSKLFHSWPPSKGYDRDTSDPFNVEILSLFIHHYPGTNDASKAIFKTY